MKKFIMAVVFSAVLGTSVHAYGGIRYFWSFGDIGVSWENITGNTDICTYMNAGNFNWITPAGFGFGFNFINFEGTYDWRQLLILPVEVSYSPFRDGDNNPIFTFYGRGGWMTRFDHNGKKIYADKNMFFGAAGFRASWFPLLANSWSVYSGAFIEYTTKGELRIGISVDLTIFALFWLWAGSD